MDAILIEISTGKILKQGKYPSLEIVPIQGLSSDMEWYLIENLPRPIYDVETERLEKFERTTTRTDLVYTFLKIYEKGYNVIGLNPTELAEKEKQKKVKDIDDVKSIILTAKSPDGSDWIVTIDDMGKINTEKLV